MPRTQQSAIKSTGGRSERKPLRTRGNVHYDTSDVHMSSPPALPSLPGQAQEKAVAKAKALDLDVSNHSFLNIYLLTASLQWCYSCIDGGNLVMCDLCDRAICTTRCLKFPIEFTEVKKSNLGFACPTCHNDYYHRLKMAMPYFVSSPSFFSH
jgi:hypothetical protein